MGKPIYELTTHFLPRLLKDLDFYIIFINMKKMPVHQEIMNTIFQSMGLKCILIDGSYCLHGNRGSVLLEKSEGETLNKDECIQILQKLRELLAEHERYHPEYDENMCYQLWYDFEDYLYVNRRNEIHFREVEFCFVKNPSIKIQFIRSGLGLLCCIRERYCSRRILDKILSST